MSKIMSLKNFAKSLFRKSNSPSLYFPSHQEALEFCEAKTQGAYESSVLCRYRFEKLDAYLREGRYPFSLGVMPALLFATSFFMRRSQGRCPFIVDFGGACGESVIALQKIFGDEIFERSCVIESPSQVEESKKWRFVERVCFESDLQRVLSRSEVDIFFTSGTIQSLEDPLKPLREIASRSVPIVALARNNFANSVKIVAQVSELAANGMGEHIEGYGNPKIYYPNTSVVKKEVVDIFEQAGYSVVLDLSSGTSGVYGSGNFGGDLVFSRLGE